MACVNAKKTAFGRIHDYRVCRCFQQSGRVRCRIGGDRSCKCFMDDGKEDLRSPHSVEDLQYLELQDRIQKALIAGRVRQATQRLEPFFEGALAQMPDGGAAYYESCNPFLPDLDHLEKLVGAFAAR